MGGILGAISGSLEGTKQSEAEILAFFCCNDIYVATSHATKKVFEYRLRGSGNAKKAQRTSRASHTGDSKNEVLARRNHWETNMCMYRQGISHGRGKQMWKKISCGEEGQNGCKSVSCTCKKHQ